MTPERDGVTSKTVVVALAAATLAADANSGLIDMLGYRRATLALHVGVGGITFTGTNKVEFVLQAGNDSGGSDLVNVTDDDVVKGKDGLTAAAIANGIIRTLNAAHAAADVQSLSYIGGKRYLKLTADFSGTHGTGTPMSAELVLETPNIRGAA